MKKLFCFGYGYVCAYLAHQLIKSDEKWEIAGTTRDAEKRQALREAGIGSYFFHENKPLTDPKFLLKDTTHLLLSAPPGDEGDYAFEFHAQDVLDLMPKLTWVGYLSSTSVYGDRGGAWVDETAGKDPSSRRGSKRARAEEQWLSLKRKYSLPVHVFRLSGIYGPGRSAIDSVRAGNARRLDKPGHAFSRIHVADIASVLKTSMDHPNPGAIYNLSDDMPAPSHEIIAYACELLGIEPPPLIPFDEADIAPMVNSFYKDNKRVLNDKIKNELGINLQYPNYRLGLQACLEDENNLEFLNW